MKIIDQGKSLKETRAQIEKTLQQIWASDPNAAGAEKMPIYWGLWLAARNSFDVGTSNATELNCKVYPSMIIY
jgi:hypothetical protein